MIKTVLWPTEVYQITISNDVLEYVYADVISHRAQEVPPEDMNKLGAFNLISDSIKQIGNITIEDVWIRTTDTASNNNFEIHCDSHKGTTHIGILWLTGEHNNGGDVNLYDPAWRNPQNSQFENQQHYSFKHRIKFKVGELILFPSNVWHEVTSYHGSVNRLSLNFAINLNGINN